MEEVEKFEIYKPCVIGMAKLYPKSRILIKDASGKIYRPCSFFHEPQRGGTYNEQYYMKFMFPDLRHKNLLRVTWSEGTASEGTSDQLEEISFHYDTGKITCKHKGKRSFEINATNLNEKGILFLLTLRWKDLSWLKEFSKNKEQIEHDIYLKDWDEKPRGMQFILTKDPVPEIVLPDGLEICETFGFRDKKTKLWLTLVDCYLIPKEIPRKPASILVHVGGSTTQLLRLVE